MIKSQREYYIIIMYGVSLVMIIGVVLLYIPSTSLYHSQYSELTRLLLWLIFAYVILSVCMVIVERTHIASNSTIPSYKDLTLEFRNLPDSIKTEEGLISKLNSFGISEIKEVSFNYDLSEYFSLQDEIANLSKILPLPNELAESQRKLADFKKKFSENPQEYFTSGSGHITFKHPKGANNLKQIFVESRHELNSNWEKLKNSFFSVLDYSKSGKEKILQEVTSQPRMTFFHRPSSPVEARKRNSLFKSPIAHIADSLLVQDRAKRMIQTLGPNFRVFRGFDPETSSLNYSKSKIGNFEMAYKITFILIILPSFAYYFNYKYYEILIGSKIGKINSLFSSALQYAYLIGTILVDQVAFTFIQIFFYNRKYLRTALKYSFAMTFTSYYIILSSIILPNFAMKRAYVFWAQTPVFPKSQIRPVLEFLINSLYFNYYSLIFSVINFKLFKPIINRFLFNKSASDYLMTKNSEIVFTLSFITNVVLSVAFYSTVTPSIFVFFAFVSVALLFLEIFNASREFKAAGFFNMRIANPPLARAKNEDEKSDSNLTNSSTESFEDNNIEHRLPISVYSSSMNVLMIGMFILACMGYFGFTKDFSKFMSESNQDSSFFTGMFDWFANGFFSIIDFFSDSKTQKSEFHVFLSYLFDWWNYLYHKILFDWKVLIFAVIYLAYTSFFVERFRTPVLMARFQAKVWVNLSNYNGDRISGKSFREVNPAYKLMIKQA